MQFLTVHDGDLTINLAQIVSIAWNHKNQTAEVTLASGETIDVELDDYETVAKAVGVKIPVAT